MYTSKLFVYIGAFRKDEWRPFKQFLRGSKGDRSDVFRLFNNIYGCRNNLSSEKLSIEIINEDLFPHLSRKSFQNIMSVLRKQIEDYWIYSDLKNDKIRKELHRLEALNKRGFFDESNKSLISLEKKVDNDKHLDLWHDYYLVKARFEIAFSNNPIKESTSATKKILSNSIETVLSNSSNILQYYKAELYNRQLLKSENWQKEIDKINTLDVDSKPSILQQSLKEQTNLLNSGYSLEPAKLIDILKNKVLSFSPELKIAYIYHIKRYLILQVRKGDKRKVAELLHLIQWSVDSGLMLYHGELDVSFFISDLTVLCALNEIQEAEAYQKKFLEKLNHNQRAEGKVLGQMMINFTISNYDVVIDLYVSSTFKKVSRRLQAAGIFLRASFELHGQDVNYFSYHLRNTTDFIRRNKKHITVLQYRAWKNFIFFLSKITKGEEKKKIFQLFDQSKDVLHRNWLEKKIKEGVNY